MVASLKLSKFNIPEFEDGTLYKSIVGGLQCLSLTRPDILSPINKLCQFMHSSKMPHWVAIKHVLRYLSGTINLGLLFKSQSILHINTYCDVDWGGCLNDRRSIDGFYVYLVSHLISWSSKKQNTMACSSTKAEYKPLAFSATETIQIQTLLHELGIFFFSSTYSLV